MAAFPRDRSSSRAARLCLAFLFGVGLLACEASPAAAQGFGWFGGLFGGGQPQNNGGYDQSPQYRRRAPADVRRRAQRHQAPKGASAPVANKPVTAPKNAAVFVNVFGDTFGQLLANGLDDALADKSDVGVIHLGVGPSGLVNTSYYDWQKTIDDMLSRQGKDAEKPADTKTEADKTAAAKPKPKDSKAQKIDVAVMMIGSNDRQPITLDGKRLQPGTDEWNAAYRKRALAIAEAFQKRKIPLVWVGLPIVKNDDFADDMAALNEIFRDVAARTGATYVDTWEAFSDADGNFSAYGPDISGQTVRLRTNEGIFFTKAGARKLAHFVEPPVRRDLDAKTPAPQLPTDAAPAVSSKEPAKDPKNPKAPPQPTVAMVKPDAGPIKNLSEPPAAKDGALMPVPSAANPESAENRDAVAANAPQKPKSPIGRADDFRWSGDGAPPAQ